MRLHHISCLTYGITRLWIKEHPVHFDRFIQSDKCFFQQCDSASMSIETLDSCFLMTDRSPNRERASVSACEVHVVVPEVLVSRAVVSNLDGRNGLPVDA